MCFYSRLSRARRFVRLAARNIRKWAFNRHTNTNATTWFYTHPISFYVWCEWYGILLRLPIPVSQTRNALYSHTHTHILPHIHAHKLTHTRSVVRAHTPKHTRAVHSQRIWRANYFVRFLSHFNRSCFFFTRNILFSSHGNSSPSDAILQIAPIFTIFFVMPTNGNQSAWSYERKPRNSVEMFDVSSIDYKANACD